MEQAKKRDHKIFITDIAIDKVPYVEIAGLTAEQSRRFQQTNKEVLGQAMRINDSNEVACVYNLYTLEKSIFILGDLTHVDIESDIRVQRIKKKSYAFELVIIHNHPSTSNFSIADIDFFLSDDYYGIMSAVTNQGETHILKKTLSYDYDKVKLIQKEAIVKHQLKNQSDIVKEFLKHCSKGGVIYVGGKQI